MTLDRWTIDPVAGTVSQQRLDDRGQEFPRVDDRIISRPHRYGYSAVIGDVTRAITAAGDFGDEPGMITHLVDVAELDFVGARRARQA